MIKTTRAGRQSDHGIPGFCRRTMPARGEAGEINMVSPETVGGHSLGAQVVLDAMSYGGVDGIDHVFLVSAAVSNVTLGKRYMHADAVGRAKKITIAYDNDDSVLKYAYEASQGGVALGRTGWDKRAGPLPSNVEQQDYTGEWEGEHSSIYKESGLGFWLRNARAISCNATGGKTK